MAFSPMKVSKMRETLQSRCTHHRPNSAYKGKEHLSYSNGMFSNSSIGMPASMNVVGPVKVVRTNDYTKNISDCLHSPGFYNSPKP